MATAKLDFKQQYLAPIHCLNYEDQCFLLKRCKNGHISLKEMKNEALEKILFTSAIFDLILIFS